MFKLSRQAQSILDAYQHAPLEAEAIEKAQFKDKTYVWKNS